VKKIIKAIIFDSGGVLVDDPALELIAYCAKALGISDKRFCKVYQKFEPDFQKGIISENTLWEMVCSELNIKKLNTQSLWYEALRKVFSIKEEMFFLASSLRNNGYKIGVLSNTELPAMKYLYEQGYDMFNVLVFSCVEGARKPEERIYEITLRRLGVQPEEAIFIDDNKDYTNGAEKVGINTILFRSPDQFKKELASFSVKTE